MQEETGQNSLHKKNMQLAIKEALKAAELGEVPVGSLITIGSKVISRGHNMSILSHDSTSHAEINAIRKATKKIENYRLNNATLYSTLEPCLMCYGAIIHARIARVVFGAFDNKTGACGSCHDLKSSQCLNHEPEIIGGVLEDKCALILKAFFKAKRS